MFEFGKKGAPDGSSDALAQELSRQDTPAPLESRPRMPAATSSRREAAIIGPSIHLDGDLRGQEDLLIEGEVSGTVQLRNNSLTIGSQGKVKANVYAKEVIVEGLVEGDLFGAERVVIRKSAQVRGNITSPRVSIEEGASFKGSIEMDSTQVEAALGKNRGAGAAKAAPTPQPAPPAASRPSATEVPGAAARSGTGPAPRSGAAG